MKLEFKIFQVPEHERTCTACGGYGRMRGETLNCYYCHGTGMLFCDSEGNPIFYRYIHLAT